MKVAVTGAHGFVGWHLRCALHAAGIDAVPLGRDDDWSASPQVDTVVHAAGVNRGVDEAIESGNIEAAQRLSSALSALKPSHVIYLNSSRAVDPTPYGRGKSRAGHILSLAARSNGARFDDLVVPNVFGEHGRPNYNSFVATFCSQVVRGERPTIHQDATLDLTHVGDVADTCVRLLRGTTDSSIRTYVTSVGSVAELLAKQHSAYAAGILPDLTDPFERRMFNTLRSFLFPQAYPRSLELKTDQRGSLVETIKAGSGGQCFVSWTKPGITRGNHYHRVKFERFLVLEGTADIRLRRLLTNETTCFRVSGDSPQPVDMPTLHTHSITNVGEGPLLTLFWTDEIFDPNAPDTYAEPVALS